MPHKKHTTTLSLYRRRVIGFFILVLLLVLMIILSFLFGARYMTWDTLIHALPDAWQQIKSGQVESTDNNATVISHLRYPRTVLGIFVGAALGVAGALVQGHTRNPLADPGILGISSGASLAVVLGFTFFGISSMQATVVVAFLGSIAATMLVFGLASVGKGSMNPLTLILGGAALAAVLSSITSSLILSNQSSLDHLRFWTAGALSGRELSVAWGIAPFIVLGVIAAFSTASSLNLLNLGEDTAQSLGVNVGRQRFIGMALIALLAAAATAAAGPIGFVGLVVPHIVRAITGPDYRWILPYSALTGSVLLLAADVVGRVVARPGELQVGIVLAFVGAPVFLFLLYRRKVVKL
ncbi:iron ABC transporter permease [Corynebacterium sp. sy017]|uniref:FecCD family ABC transporter permease n=1 Tax=unclassified Corynebacterium TaxID=2624378 RepID=UPI00118705A4|nr:MULTISPECIES: iron ABC transporter permease [unclassified Corynebacterium]MBP3088812.1 iron ABC transporter permease [Corynebacterium sp. sy017]QDZ42203.1 iron ABC transporter permease [Corynebacterium sp. sy039]TSD91155.1 iron ABC transporter permease [Corynebacterium sp. SY003]